MKTTLRILALSLAVLGMVAVLVSCKDGSTSDSGSSSPASQSTSPTPEKESKPQPSFGSIGDIPEVDW